MTWFSRGAGPRHVVLPAVLVLVVSALIALGLATGLVVHMAAAAETARRDAADFHRPSTTVSASRIISIVGDELTLPADGADPNGPAAATTWPGLLGQSLDARVFVVDSGGSYARPATAGGSTFVNSAGDVAPRADLVIFFGGRDDAGVSRTRLLDDSGRAFAAATATAPNARLVVIGPISPSAPVDPQLLDVRDALRTAVRRTHGTFIDPIAAGWFRSRSDYFASNGELNASGQRRMTRYVLKAVSAELP